MGSAILPNGTVLHVLPVNSSVASSTVTLPDSNDCVAQVGTPTAAIVPVVGLQSGVAFSPLLVSLSTSTAGATLFYTLGAGTETVYTPGAPLLVPACGSDIHISARATKPGLLDSIPTSVDILPAANTSVAYVAECEEAVALPVGSGWNTGSIAPGGGGGGRDANCSVVLVLSYASPAGYAGTFKIARTDAGGSYSVVVAVANGYSTTISLGELPGAPTLQLYGLIGGAWSSSGFNNVTVSPSCQGIAQPPSVLPGALNLASPGGPSLPVTITSAYANSTTFFTLDGSDPTQSGGSREWFSGTSSSIMLQPLPMWMLGSAVAADNCTMVAAYSSVSGLGPSPVTVTTICLPTIGNATSLCGQIVVLSPSPTPHQRRRQLNVIVETTETATAEQGSAGLEKRVHGVAYNTRIHGDGQEARRRPPPPRRSSSSSSSMRFSSTTHSGLAEATDAAGAQWARRLQATTSDTLTATSTGTNSVSPEATGSSTPTGTSVSTSSATSTLTATSSPTHSLTSTSSQTGTSSITSTTSATPSRTLSLTSTSSSTSTATVTSSTTGSGSHTPSHTGSSSNTPSQSSSPSSSSTGSSSPSSSSTGTSSPSSSKSATASASSTASSTASSSSSASSTASGSTTPSNTAPVTHTRTRTGTMSPTSTRSSSHTRTPPPPTPSVTASPVIFDCVTDGGSSLDVAEGVVWSLSDGTYYNLTDDSVYK